MPHQWMIQIYFKGINNHAVSYHCTIYLTAVTKWYTRIISMIILTITAASKKNYFMKYTFFKQTIHIHPNRGFTNEVLMLANYLEASPLDIGNH